MDFSSCYKSQCFRDDIMYSQKGVSIFVYYPFEKDMWY